MYSTAFSRVLKCNIFFYSFFSFFILLRTFFTYLYTKLLLVASISKFLLLKRCYLFLLEDSLSCSLFYRIEGRSLRFSKKVISRRALTVALYRLYTIFLNLSILSLTLQTITFLFFYVIKLFILSASCTAFANVKRNIIYCIRVR